ncbi:hypothetical protein V7S43_009653 [Phytophthora oleae]|uniref:N-acetyltransferase domain-containing protein n=1 Tax=Phytophthora oleae TaxID=2107226 RepID=A0ABD3FJ76_9STRA
MATHKTSKTEIRIRQYRPEDHADVTKIFVLGLMAFDDNLDFRYLWEERLRTDLTNDFADIEASHIAPGGNFWRLGVGREIMAELERWSKENGIKKLFLTTSPKKKQALAFYNALGYTKVDEIVCFWENPRYFEADKFEKLL